MISSVLKKVGHELLVVNIEELLANPIVGISFFPLDFDLASVAHINKLVDSLLNHTLVHGLTDPVLLNLA